MRTSNKIGFVKCRSNFFINFNETFFLKLNFGNEILNKIGYKESISMDD